MHRILAILAGLGCTAVAGAFIFLLHQYETEGFGLAPWIAIPCAVVMLVNGWFAFKFAAEG